MNMIDSAGDDRTANNGVRHQYRSLTEDEKATMVAVKDKAADLLAFLNTMPPSREVSIAKTKTEEAAMWAVKAITA